MNGKTSSPLLFICAGETSGDHHGSGLMQAISKRLPETSFFGIGGDDMVKTGLDALFHVRDMSIIGFTEVIKQLPRILKIFRSVKSSLKTRKPDLIILIDYPGFNLRVAEAASRLGIPVIYYISPQVWAWGRNRIARIASTVDHMIVIFPFEEAIYREAGVNTTFVGHPLKETVKAEFTKEDFCRSHDLDGNKRIIGLLPGSRHQEISRLLPDMVKMAGLLSSADPEIQFVLGKAPGIAGSLYQEFLPESPIIKPIRATYDVMAHSDLLVVASGTATLEAALLKTPMIIVYRISPLSYLIAKQLVNIDSIGLVNIVAGKRLIPELVQEDLTPERLAEEANRFFQDPEYLKTIIAGLDQVEIRLGRPGATKRAGDIIADFLTQSL